MHFSCGRTRAVKTTLVSRLRLWRAAGALSVGVVAAGGTAHADERAALLAAIHHLENPRNLTRPGAHGELGAYQFRPTTWQLHTTAPFTQALNRTMSDLVAEKHYEWIKRGLQRARVPATSYNIALAWNSGVAAVVNRRAPRAAHRYAQRAVNLLATFLPPSTASAGTAPPLLAAAP